jgi:hypothetical protein
MFLLREIKKRLVERHQITTVKLNVIKQTLSCSFLKLGICASERAYALSEQETPLTGEGTIQEGNDYMYFYLRSDV